MASIPSFIFGAGTKYKTQEELERAREQVKEMLGDIGQSGYTGWGGVMADLGKAIGSRVEKGRIGEGQEFLTGEQSKLWDMFGGGGGGVGDIATASGSDALAGGAGGDMTGYQNAIAGIESGGRYDAVGPRHPKMGRALGKYQVMEANVGPWSRKHLGREVSPEEFLASPQIQDAIFNGEFGTYVAKYGPEGAARAWIGGPGGVSKPGRRDSLGTSVGDYGRRFTNSLGGGGGSDTQAGRGAGDSFLQAKPRRRMTPAMLEQESGTEQRPLWDDSPLAGRRRMTPAMLGTDEAPTPPAVPSPLDGRRRMTPNMLNPGAVPDAVAPPPIPAPNPARFGPTPPVPVAAPVPLQPPNPDRFAPAAFVPPAPQIFTPPAAPRADRLGTPPPSMAGTETAPYPVPGRSMAGTETASPQFAPTPAQPPIPVARQQVDPFTDMILGDQAKNYRPGGYIPPAPVASAFPVAPPAPGTPAAAGFGVPQQAMAGGAGANRQVGGGGGQFPPPPPAPGQQQAGGGDKIAKLMFIMSSPYASKEQKLMAASMLEREYALEDERRKAEAEKNDPAYKLGLRKAELEVQGLEEKNNMEDVVVVGNRLYNKKTKEWVTPPDGAAGGPFDSTSVEGQALNGMVKNGTLTVQQAYDLATGKTVTDAKGRTLFFTGTELVGAGPGETPQPIDPNAPVQAPAPAPGTTTAPAGRSGGRVLAEGDAEKPPTNFRWKDENDHSKGTEPIPGGPGEQMPAELAARVGLANDALKILPSVEEKVKEGLVTGAWDWASAAAGRGEAGVLYREIRAGSEALVRMLTGAGKNESEARDEASMYLPQAWDDAATLTSKIQQLQRRLIATVTEAQMGRRAEQRDLEEGARLTKTGVTWSTGK